MNITKRLILLGLLAAAIVALVGWAEISFNTEPAVPTPTSVPTPSPTVIPTPGPYGLSPAELGVIADINRYRVKLGLLPVHPDQASCRFAQVRLAETMGTDWNHQGFVDRGKSGALPYPNYLMATENLARYFPDSSSVVSGWIASPTHDKNLRADTPFVCVQSTTNPNEDNQSYWVMEGWKGKAG